EDAAGAKQDRLSNPQRDGVALDELVKRGIDRLGGVIARGKPVRTGQEIAVRLGYGVVGVHDLGGDPARLPPQQIISLDPGDPRALVEPPAARAYPRRV